MEATNGITFLVHNLGLRGPTFGFLDPSSIPISVFVNFRNFSDNL